MERARQSSGRFGGLCTFLSRKRRNLWPRVESVSSGLAPRLRRLRRSLDVLLCCRAVCRNCGETRPRRQARHLPSPRMDVGAGHALPATRMSRSAYHLHYPRHEHWTLHCRQREAPLCLLRWLQRRPNGGRTSHGGEAQYREAKRPPHALFHHGVGLHRPRVCPVARQAGRRGAAQRLRTRLCTQGSCLHQQAPRYTKGIAQHDRRTDRRNASCRHPYHFHLRPQRLPLQRLRCLSRSHAPTQRAPARQRAEGAFTHRSAVLALWAALGLARASEGHGEEGQCRVYRGLTHTDDYARSLQPQRGPYPLSHQGSRVGQPPREQREGGACALLSGWQRRHFQSALLRCAHRQRPHPLSFLLRALGLHPARKCGLQDALYHYRSQWFRPVGRCRAGAQRYAQRWSARVAPRRQQLL